MNREDIIRMAREAGFQEGDGACVDKLFSPHGYDPYSLTAELERFAALVAAAERERFADECIDIVARWGGSVEIEAAIRARSNT